MLKMDGKLIIKDEIHGIIELEGVYKELVECQEFQRLKDIIQTGTSYHQYPEMEQETRFDHSVGSYYLMCHIIEHIEEKLEEHGMKVKEEEKEIAKIAMLLHDVGHGAYSHTLEKITGYSHEKRSIDIVKEKDTQIHQILTNYYGEEVANKVGLFLERVYEHKKQDKPLDDVKIEQGTVNLEDLLASLISNNIDADRLDYLVRDSQKAGFRILTEVDKLIESFEFVLDVDKIIVALPEEKKTYADVAIFERARNYKDIYYCDPSIIGDHVLEILLEELRNHPEEVPKERKEVIHRFLTNSKAKFSTKEYMMITETPIREILDTIQRQTQNEKIRALCDMGEMIKGYQTLNTDKKEDYIRYLLHKAIPEISEDTKGVIEETRWIKPYKSNENENINMITRNGIEDYKDVKQDLIKLEPFSKRTVAISKEMIRLELGVSEEEFREKYQDTIEEIISTITKPKDEFELRYVVTDGVLDGEGMKEKIEGKYEIVDSVQYLSNDVYYDNPETYELLDKKKALRIRRGTAIYKGEETYQYKKTRATYKTYQKEQQSSYTSRRKEEEIGSSTRIQDYKEFLDSVQIEPRSMRPMLEVNNLRRLYTIKVNGVLLDISFNTAYYQNEIYEMFGNIGTIEIKPRDNKVSDRLSMLEFREFLERENPELAKFLSNTNVYEIGMLDTYEKYKKGYIDSEEIKEYEEKHPERAEKLEEILQRAKQNKDFRWLNQIPTAEEKKKKTETVWEGRGE